MMNLWRQGEQKFKIPVYSSVQVIQERLKLCFSLSRFSQALILERLNVLSWLTKNHPNMRSRLSTLVTLGALLCVFITPINQHSSLHCCTKNHPMGLTAGRLQLLRGKTTPPFMACLHFPFPPGKQSVCSGLVAAGRPIVRCPLRPPASFEKIDFMQL